MYFGPIEQYSLLDISRHGTLHVTARCHLQVLYKQITNTAMTVVCSVYYKVHPITGHEGPRGGVE
jgi:hypothetical protein